MAISGKIKGKKRFAPALLAAAGLALAIPGAGLAVGGSEKAGPIVEELGYLPFTPANADPQLALRVAELIGAEALRFTPASSSGRKDRTVTVAVRIDEATALAMSLRTGPESSSKELGRIAALAPTRYNLGIARGYQTFVEPKPAALPAGLRDLDMPDLADFRANSGGKGDKPSRFQTRIALEQGDRPGRAPRTLEDLGERSVDVGGSYRLGRNLNVTAGVRLSRDRDRLAPLTDGEEDSQAVYVGTQIRF